ncbi:MAG: hypothetical protein HYR72_00585 [Deltaproteobacteria bacterium]|nr:hypothetical protein [Deltaproteobacteria bacterium]MBI3389473.1 hypothetical protein [Deltaproteobacteria bacterium]
MSRRERVTTGALALAAVAFVAWVRLLPLALQAVPENVKGQLRYHADDGRDYTCLGDYDSYAWLSDARTYLRTGATCEKGTDGKCHDGYSNAPVGRRTMYNHSAHFTAIVAVQRILTWFDAGFPLPASSFLVQAIVGALGVLPAFCLGRRLAGNLAGVAAAVVIGANPVFLERSLGSDNDVWNVILPLWMFAAAGAALAATGWRRAMYVLAAALAAGLHLATWRGWFFTYMVLLAGLAAYVLLVAAQALLDRRRAAAAYALRLRTALIVSGMFYLATGAAAWMNGSLKGYLRAPGIVAEFMVREAPESSARGAPTRYWPDVFVTVGELRGTNLSSVADGLGGRAYFALGCLGLLLLALPRSDWKRWQLAIFIGGSCLYGYLALMSDVGRLVLIAMLAMPLGLALGLHVVTADDASDRGAGVIVIAWFLSALFQAHSGLRFVMLLVPPFGIAFGVLLGRLQQWLRDAAARLVPASARVAGGVAFIALAGTLVLPVQRGYAVASNYVPRINAAWWEALRRIRDETSSSAIVTTWWDYGYWVKFVAERRGSADGGSLMTHIPHWIARAFLAPTEREAIGLLRMLDCGSDATPDDEGDAGAYGRLLAAGVDEVTAHGVILQLASMDRSAAQQYLAKRGIESAASARILAASHCSPPPAYLVLSSELIDQPAWRHLGSWDVERAYIATHARDLPLPAAVADLMQRFGHSRADATRLYLQATALQSEAAVRNFIGPATGYVDPNWKPCRAPSEAGDVICPVDVPLDRGTTVLDEFRYHIDAPANGRLLLHRTDSGSASHRIDSVPASIVIAGADHLDEVSPASATDARLGVLLDLVNQRVLIGPPYLLRSTFTHLVYLDGRYAQFFEKFDERIGYKGERVVTWKINWPDP